MLEMVGAVGYNVGHSGEKWDKVGIARTFVSL